MNAADLLTRLTGIGGTSARVRIQHAHAIATRTTLTGEPLPARFPAVRDALSDGAIAVDSVTAIVTALAPLADRCDPTHLAAAEHELVAAAIGAAPDGAPACSADDTRIQAKVWALVLDPDGTLPDDERALRRRGFRLGRERDGIVPVTGNLLPDVAAQFQRLADAQLNPRVEDRTDDPGVRFRPAPDSADAGADGDEPRDTRTHEQKLHDVLATILGVAARSAESPTLGGLPPTLLVTIAADELDRDDGVAFIDGTDSTVPALVARHVACCGGIQRLIFNTDGRIIELGTPQRGFTGQQRRAITARDGACIIPGCQVPAAWCEVHHVEEHARGGPTHVDNGVPLCWYHHRTIDTSGWEIRMIDGVPQVRAPAAIDPARQWRPTSGSLHRARDALRRQLLG
nr:HNH endonuclease signature motif containing protein [Microbacterium bovistercoris]